MNRTRTSLAPDVLLDNEWTQLTTPALDVLNKLAAISLIDATRCGQSLRAILVEQVEEGVEQLLHGQARLPTRPGNGHLKVHFHTAVRELGAASLLLRKTAPPEPCAFELHLKRATGHLKAITRATCIGQLFDLSKCCGAPHAVLEVCG